MLIHVKDGVTFAPMTPELMDGIITATQVLYKYGYNLVITSGSDGVHPAGGDSDPHYLGYAVDIRSRDMKVQDVPQVVVDLKNALGIGWHVVQESDHLHLQNQKFHTAASATDGGGGTR